MNDETIISFVFDKQQRSRWRTLLANPKKRAWILDKLEHNPPLDEKNTTWYKTLTKATNDLKVSPSSIVYLMSGFPELDQKDMSWAEAIEKVPQAGFGSIICISPSLAVYYGETGERAAIIRRKI